MRYLRSCALRSGSSGNAILLASEQSSLLAVSYTHLDVYKRQEQLVSDLLLLSSIDSQGVHVDIQPINLDQIARSITERLLPQAEERKQELSFTRLGKLPLIYGDRVALERICLLYTSRCV